MLSTVSLDTANIIFHEKYHNLFCLKRNQHLFDMNKYLSKTTFVILFAFELMFR